MPHSSELMVKHQSTIPPHCWRLSESSCFHWWVAGDGFLYYDGYDDGYGDGDDDGYGDGDDDVKEEYYDDNCDGDDDDGDYDDYVPWFPSLY